MDGRDAPRSTDSKRTNDTQSGNIIERRLSIATGSPYLSLRASVPVADAALRAALKYNHSVYDALYSALAIEHRCDFVTADRALANKLHGVFPFIVHLSAIKP
jgi:predicted nucleic acid-binding protein